MLQMNLEIDLTILIQSLWEDVIDVQYSVKASRA